MKTTFKWLAVGGVLVLAIAAALMLAGSPQSQASSAMAAVDGAPPQLRTDVERGEYLTRAADCVACHTAEGGRPFAGGRAFALPFGTLYSTNITPDPVTGIGAWSDGAFIRAVRQGVGPEGHLYPAMPYTSYSAMSDRDLLAIKAYLFSLPPVDQPRRANAIGFPFNQRWGLHLWDMVFFRDQRYQSVDSQGAQWNRGAYLIDALGHCGECHTPRNLGFAMSRGRYLAGAEIEGWVAPNLSADREAGLGSWSLAQLEQYLSSGHAPGRSTASGPMAAVIENSLQYLSAEDISAMAHYLASVPAHASGEGSAVNLQPSRQLIPGSGLPMAVEGNADPAERLFAGDCAGCHLWDGQGRQSNYADLLGTRSVNDPSARSVVQAILDGSRLRVGDRQEAMPAFADRYSDAEIAQLANHVIALFGAQQGQATAEQVAKQRAER